MQNSNTDDKEAVAVFYRSRLYSELANENLKLHLKHQKMRL